MDLGLFVLILVEVLLDSRPPGVSFRPGHPRQRFVDVSTDWGLAGLETSYQVSAISCVNAKLKRPVKATIKLPAKKLKRQPQLGL